MMNNNTEVKIDQTPLCDLCPPFNPNPAKYDAKTKFTGQWGYLCEKHFKSHGIGLGLGLGQKLIVEV